MLGDVAEERDDEVAAGGVTGEDDRGGGDAPREERVVGRHGVLERGGEAAARVGGDTVLEAEDVAIGVGGQEGGAVAEIGLTAVADDEGAAVEMEDDCFAFCVGGGLVDGGVPGSSHLDGLDLFIVQHTAVYVLLARGDALVAVFFGAR